MQSSHYKTVQFRAIAADPATEVFLIDASLRRIGTSVGKLEAEIRPGFYKVRFRAGASQTDELIEVSGEEESTEIYGKPVLFRSAAPILNTLAFDSEQSGQATSWSHQPDETGTGAGFLLFLRAETAEVEFDVAGIALHDLEGTQIADLATGRRNDAARCAGLSLQLDPGTYRLRVSKPELGDYEIFVTLSPGWQTQVFLALEGFIRGEERIQAPSLRRAAIFMTREGRGFDPGHPNLRLTELAKQAHLQGRKIVSTEMINRFLDEKFEDPMMGIFAAHILMKARRRNTDLIQTVLNNLERMLGDTPDIRALFLAVDHEEREHQPIDNPPLLAASWKMLSKATRKNARLISPHSVPGRVAHNIVNGGVWLLHRVVESADVSPQSLAHSEEMFREMLNVPTEALRAISADRTRVEELSALEQSLLGLLVSKNSMRELLEDLPERDRRTTDPGRLIWRIQAPTYSVAAAVQSLNKKMGEV